MMAEKVKVKGSGNHPNSLKNLERRPNIGDIPGAIEKGQQVRKERARIRRTLNEHLTEEQAHQLANVIIKEAMDGDVRMMKLLVELNENWKNRELRLKDKEVKNQESLLDHMKNVAFVQPVEIGDVTEYEETKREIE